MDFPEELYYTFEYIDDEMIEYIVQECVRSIKKYGMKEKSNENLESYEFVFNLYDYLLNCIVLDKTIMEPLKLELIKQKLMGFDKR